MPSFSLSHTHTHIHEVKTPPIFTPTYSHYLSPNFSRHFFHPLPFDNNFLAVHLSFKMVQLREKDEMEMKFMVEEREKKPKFCINDNVDVLIEILKRVDGRSLGVAGCVCRLWCAITRNDSLWEHLCFRHASPPPQAVKTVVVALGGYKRLYMVCMRPVLNRLGRFRRMKAKGGSVGNGGGGESDSDLVRRVWTRHEVELSLSLFCVDYYERVLLSGAGDGSDGGGGRLGGDSSALSLMFLCKAVNV